MKWFRFYSEVLHDSKVQTLSADMFRAWINLLCVANEGERRGCLPDMKQIAFALRIKEEKATQIVRHLVGCGLIDEEDDGALRPHNWDKRQRNSDDVSNRVREHRRRKTTVSGNRDVTLHETRMEQDETQSNCRVRQRRLETETETEQTPLPPMGGVWVSEGGSEPTPIESSPEAALPEVDAIELARVQAKADRLFPMYDFGHKVWGIAGDFPLAWIDSALSELHASGKDTWNYMLGILKRYARQGGPENPVSGPIPSVPPEPIETPEQRDARLAKAAEGMKAYRAQLAQEGRRAPHR